MIFSTLARRQIQALQNPRSGIKSRVSWKRFRSICYYSRLTSIDSVKPCCTHTCQKTQTRQSQSTPFVGQCLKTTFDSLHGLQSDVRYQSSWCTLFHGRPIICPTSTFGCTIDAWHTWPSIRRVLITSSGVVTAAAKLPAMEPHIAPCNEDTVGTD